MRPGFVRDLQAMIVGMTPVLDDTHYRFVDVTPDHAAQILSTALATFREDEGVSAIVPVAIADELDLEGPAFAHITLQVYSDLEGVGLTAAVATALASEGMACNVVAALRHDHLFVPSDRASEALQTLKDLQASKRG